MTFFSLASFSLGTLLFASSQYALADTTDSKKDPALNPVPKSTQTFTQCSALSSYANVNTTLATEHCGSDEQFITAAILSGAALFGFDSNELPPAGDAALKKLIKDLAEFSEIRGIKVTGHTDNSGPAVYNQYLSEIRAQAIGTYFISAFPTVAVQVVGKGETEPLTSNATRAGRYKNRRVRIEVTAVR